MWKKSLFFKFEKCLIMIISSFVSAKSAGPFTENPQLNIINSNLKSHSKWNWFKKPYHLNMKWKQKKVLDISLSRFSPRTRVAQNIFISCYLKKNLLTFIKKTFATLKSKENKIYIRVEFTGKKCKTAILLYCFHYCRCTSHICAI